MWRFVVADVTQPLIGVDLLSHFGLLVDCRNNHLLDGTTSLSFPAIDASSQIASVKVISCFSRHPLLRILDLIRPPGVQREVQHNTVHHIRTKPCTPVTCRPRRLAPDRLTIAKAVLDAILRDGTARHSESPLLYISYPRRSTVGDPAEIISAEPLNARTIHDRYPVRHKHDYSHQLSGGQNQIPVHSGDVQKIAITTPFVFFEFPFMSFGLRNAAETFQRIMDDILLGIDFCFAYLDDILVFSRSLEKHERQLRALFCRLQTYEILINPSKCLQSIRGHLPRLQSVL
jgi:hypothetical protein